MVDILLGLQGRPSPGVEGAPHSRAHSGLQGQGVLSLGGGTGATMHGEGKNALDPHRPWSGGKEPAFGQAVSSC